VADSCTIAKASEIVGARATTIASAGTAEIVGAGTTACEKDTGITSTQGGREAVWDR